MTSPQTTAPTDPQSTNAALQQRLDSALVREAALAEELATRTAELARRTAEMATRTSEFGERIEHQAATLDVLKVMSASPGDAQPVFDLIVRHATELCNVPSATLFEYDGELVHIRSDYRSETILAPSALAAYVQLFPMRPTRGSISCRAILDRQIIHIQDLRLDPELAGFARELGHRSQVSVPLIRDDLAIGVITIGALAAGGFSDSQVELLKTFAEQAVIAITSAETYRELHAALEQQTATSEVLQVINASPGNLAPVFDAMLEKAMRLCAAACGGLFTYDGKRFQTVAARGVPAAMAEFREKNPPTVQLGGHVKRLLETLRPVQILDWTEEETYRSGDLDARAIVDLGGARTNILVPLLKDEGAIGFFGLYRQEVQAFTDKQIALLENLAAQAVIAMENARLLTEQQEALEQQTATAEVLQVINSSPGDLAPVFDAVLEKAHMLCGAAVGSLMTYDGEHLRVVATRGFPEGYAALIRQPFFPSAPVRTLIASERLLHAADLTAIQPKPEGLTGMLIDRAIARTGLAIPLRKDGAFLGLICVYRAEVRPFSDKEIALLENFAAQAVIAMENARLITEQREALKQQTATAEVLQVINASPGNLAPVFETILEKGTRLCGAAFGWLTAWDGEYSNVVAIQGFPPALAEYIAAREPRLAVSPVIARLAETKRSQQLPDVTAGEGYRNGHPDSRAVADLGGARTLLHVPLCKDEAMLGYITVYRTEVRLFSDKEIALLENFAAQAVIAMENARLITEQREALEQQTATAEVLQVINASPGNLAPVFDAMLEKAMRLSGAAYGVLRSYDGEHLYMLASRGVPTEYAEFLARSGGPGTPGDSPMPGTAPMQALETRQPAQRLDVRESIGYTSGIPGTRAIADLGGARTVLVVPLVKDQVAVGLLTFYRQEVRAFSDKQIALLQNFAAQAVIAMENARLLTEQREALERQTAMSEVLQVINASPGNLKPVFEAILERAMHLCEAAFGGLWTFVGDRYVATALRGVPEAYLEFAARHAELPGPGSAPYRYLHGERSVLQNIDMADDEVYRSGNVPRRGLVDIGGARTALHVPLHTKSALSVLTLYRTEVRPFTDKQATLLENFGAQAVVAMENARLLNEIRQRQAELRTTFDNMGDGVAMFDADLRLAAWNRNFQRIIDLPDTLLGMRPSYADYLRLLAERGEFGTTDIEAELSLRIEDTEKELRLERVRPDGRVIEVRRNAVPGGGFVLIYSDITERKRSEEQIRAARDAAETALRELRTAQANLIQAEKMASLGQLTAGIAHEIKNPLNFVNNFSALSTELIDELREVLAPEPLGEAARTEVDDLTALLKGNLEKVVQHGQRADGIVRSMLDHSRGSSGERRMVDLNALIDEALNLAYHGARAQDQRFNITLERDFGDSIAPIEVNPQDITRVFLNLFANGFYAVTKRARSDGDAAFVPTLKVTTRDTGDAVEIRVRDNGTGIPADIRDKLFQPFFTTKPTGEGTGLGLSITYDIVTQQHGGNIAVDSNVGEYSEFTIQLPCYRP